jgi:hypothetical protein
MLRGAVIDGFLNGLTAASCSRGRDQSVVGEYRGG